MKSMLNRYEVSLTHHHDHQDIYTHLEQEVKTKLKAPDLLKFEFYTTTECDYNCKTH